ncbi:MAG: hypothetical protein Q8936_21985 [Bacillota bacterium]|nr:hypothetical protein [Bacillota bacterium]
MIRKLLESLNLKLTDEEFKSVMIIVTDDIKFNRINFKKKTSFLDMFSITLRAVDTVRNCA